jgi:hypothetical protein
MNPKIIKRKEKIIDHTKKYYNKVYYSQNFKKKPNYLKKVVIKNQKLLKSFIQKQEELFQEKFIHPSNER